MMQTPLVSPSSSSSSSYSSASLPSFPPSRNSLYSNKNPILPTPQSLSFTKARRTSPLPPPQTMSNSAVTTTGEGPPQKEVKLWGGRFEGSVTDAVEKFTESISFDKALYKHDIMGSRAHASMLAHQGLISESDKDRILQGLDAIERQIEAGKFVWRTDREDVHMNIEAALTDLVGEPAKKLHTARSRNDQVSTDFRLWCRDSMDTIVECIKHLQVV